MGRKFSENLRTQIGERINDRKIIADRWEEIATKWKTIAEKYKREK